MVSFYAVNMELSIYNMNTNSVRVNAKFKIKLVGYMFAIVGTALQQQGNNHNVFCKTTIDGKCHYGRVSRCSF